MGTKSPSVRQVVQTVKKSLRQLGDPQKAQDYQRYFKEPVTMLGVGTQPFRKVIKEQTASLKNTWTLQQAMACCDRLMQEKELELRGAGHTILGAFAKQFTLELTAPAQTWLEQRLDNWALVDGFCSNVTSPLLQTCPDFAKTLSQWSQTESLWVRRAALVTLVPFARRGEYLVQAYDLVQEHFGDSEDLMHKAMGWLLREAGKTDMKRLSRHLLKHGPAIPRTTVRYAIERFPTVERKLLLEQTKE